VLLPHVRATHHPMDEWMLGWLARNAMLLVDRAPRAAAEFLRQAVADSLGSSGQRGFLAARLADALYRVGDTAEAEQVANCALVRAADADLLVDLHWTLVQCRMMTGRQAESLAALHRVLASPGMSARQRARLLVLAARTHSYLGEVETAGRAAATALAAATEADDNLAIGWALHTLATVTGVQGQMADALALFEQALTVTLADPALTDLRLLVQINKAVTLGNLDRHEEALATVRQARQLADQAGTVIRLTQAHSALGQLLFDTGRWDEAMAEVAAQHESLKSPPMTCYDLGIAAVICFHRGKPAQARRHLAAAIPHARQLGNRVAGSLTLARSLDCEHAGALPEALAVLTTELADNTEQLDEVEDLLADAVRLAAQVGDFSTAQALADHAAALASGSQIPHRAANALYCRGLLDHDTTRLLTAADRYSDASRPLLCAQALEAATDDFVLTGDRDQAQAAFTRAVTIYASLGAVADAARLQDKC
jgi:tetratricopeptide (TPR) repeat protein